VVYSQSRLWARRVLVTAGMGWAVSMFASKAIAQILTDLGWDGDNQAQWVDQGLAALVELCSQTLGSLAAVSGVGMLACVFVYWVTRNDGE
jgi:hypothetical protein